MCTNDNRMQMHVPDTRIRNAFFLLLFLFTFFRTIPLEAQLIRMEAKDFRLLISDRGQVTEMSDPETGTNYLATGEPAPLLQVLAGKTWEEPASAKWDAAKNILHLDFRMAGVSASVRIINKKTHLVLELVNLKSKKNIDAIYWGPYPTLINETIGEVVGVVRTKFYAIGLQSLNTKTLGGLLTNDEGSDYTRGTVAISKPYGSSLQAFSLDRSRQRNITVWNGQYPNMPVNALPGETPVGSKIALFGCSEKEVLNRIGTIEQTEDLPHPMIGDCWVKQSPETGRAYLISDFNEDNIDAMLKYTKQAGLMSLYHEGPFLSWGHFILNEAMFPHGNAGLKSCVEKASRMNIRIGVHTLTSFINTNDPYVSPVPDQRLATTGTATLADAIPANAEEIPVSSAEYFKNLQPSTLHAVRIGNEIIRFRDVSASMPYKLLECQRGAFYTRASAHKKGDTAAMLLDYPYQTLFPNFELQQEIAGNLARFFNETGVSQMDFDGHEGCISTGQGDYAMQAFAEKVFRETDHTLVNGTSRSSHYYWHICHYWNWGEPWYGGFRESQGDYRLDNQPLLERNYMPNMLGWFLLSSTTTVNDIEWMMARAAGYHAGFALVASYKNLKKNPQTDELLHLINIWQEASRSNIFSAEQLERLKQPANDYHLEKDSTGWLLFPFYKQQFEHTQQVLQPGQPAYSEWKLDNRDAEQTFNFSFIVSGKEGIISNPWIELDGYFKLQLPGDYNAGQSIVCDGKTLKLYNEKGNFTRELEIKQAIPKLKQGQHTLRFDCGFPDASGLTVRFTMRTKGFPEKIVRR